MQTRAVVIFSIFVVVALIFVIFFYFYRGYTDVLVSSYVDKISACDQINNEDECFNRESCLGIYAPSCLNCNDLVFQSCQKISSAMAESIKSQQSVCDSTGGVWQKNKLGSFCSCQSVGINKVFNKQLGCVNP